MLGLGFVLAVDHVHVETAFLWRRIMVRTCLGALLLRNESVGKKKPSHMLDEELGQAVWISQTFLQLSQEVTTTTEETCESDREEPEQDRQTDGTAPTHSLCQS